MTTTHTTYRRTWVRDTIGDATVLTSQTWGRRTIAYSICGPLVWRRRADQTWERVRDHRTLASVRTLDRATMVGAA